MDQGTGSAAEAQRPPGRAQEFRRKRSGKRRSTPEAGFASSTLAGFRRGLARDAGCVPGDADRSRALLWSLTAVVALNFIARGQTVFDPLYSPDSYMLLDATPGAIIRDLMGNGRIGGVALNEAMAWLGFPLVRSASAQLVLAVVAFAASGYLFARAVIDDPTPIETFGFVALFTLNPLGSEFFYFSETTLRTTLAVLLASIAARAAFAPAGGASRQIWAGVAAFLAAGVYQLAVSYVAVVAAFRLLRIAGGAGAAETQGARRETVGYAKGLVSLAVGFALSAAAAYALPLFWPDIATGRMFEADPGGWATRIGFGFRIAALALFPPDSVAPTFVNALMQFMALACATLTLGAMAQRSGGLSAVIGALCLVGALLGSQAVFVLAAGTYPTARLMSPIALFFAFVVLFGYRASVEEARPWLALGIVIVTFGCVGASSSLLFEQRRLNRWDHAEANRIVARLEASADFVPGMPLAVVGSQWRYGFAGFAAWGTMKVSSLRASWSQPGVIEEATGYRFAAPSAEASEAAARYCNGRKPWPAPASVEILEGTAVVCLAQETGP
jgi:hypothetical protein